MCARRAVTDKVVFGVTAAIVVAILGWGLIWPTSFQSTMASILGWVVSNLGWLFIISATCFVLFAIWLAFSRYGRIPLGEDDEKPEFNTVSWIAMMFSAGMGIGLIFWGVTEPLTHFVNPPPGLGRFKGRHRAGHRTVPLGTPSLVDVRGGRPVDRLRHVSDGTQAADQFRVHPAARPPGVEGPIGKIIDILAIFATMFGTAASLGLGALQIGSGIEVVGWVEQGGHAAARRRCRGADPGLCRLGSVGRLHGHPVAVQHQHGARVDLGALRVRPRADSADPQPAADRPR